MSRVICIILFLIPFYLSAQSVEGIWRTVDDKDGREKSHIEVFKKDGKLHGKIIKLLDGTEAESCISCSGKRKGVPLIDMEIFWGLKQKGDAWQGGKIFDPKSDKEYKCKISLAEDPNQLNVRGYIGFSLIGRTQTWYRVQ